MTTRRFPMYGVQGYARNGYTSAVTSNAKYISVDNPIYYTNFTSTYQFPGYNGTSQKDDKVSGKDNEAEIKAHPTCNCDLKSMSSPNSNSNSNSNLESIPTETKLEANKPIETKCCGNGTNSTKENFHEYFNAMNSMYR